MSLSAPAALLVSAGDELPALLEAVQATRPDLAWQVMSTPLQAVFELCNGGYVLALFDADALPPDFHWELLAVRRAAPHTPLLSFARDPKAPRHAGVAGCAWLPLLPRAQLAGAQAGTPP